MKRIHLPLVALMGATLLLGAGCFSGRSNPHSTTTVPEAGQTYTNETYGYSFVAAKGSDVSTPQDTLGALEQLQQRVWVHFAGGANVTVGVYINGKSDVYQEDKISTDPSFKQITLNGHTAWQSDQKGSATYRSQTTVFFGKSYVYEVQYTGTALAAVDEAGLNQLLQGFTFTK
jgi:hypothetical protein